MGMDKKTVELTLVIFKAIEDIKGKDIVGIDLSKSQSYTDFVLIASGGSDRQVTAIADNILENVFQNFKKNPLGVEGYESGEWVLIDFGEVVIHIFQESIREKYHLEDMWMHCRPILEKNFVKTVKALVAKKSVQKKSRTRPKH